MISGLRSWQYEDRLKQLGLWTLEERRNHADLIEVFKIAHGFSTVSLSKMFQLDPSERTRGHSLKLIKCWRNNNVRKYCFSHRVISKWNMLDGDTVTAKTVNVSKVNWKKNIQRGWVYSWTDICSTLRL